MTRYYIDLKEENHKVEECQGNVSSHDVPHPVPVGVWAADTGHVEGVGQGMITRLTASTEGAIPVQILTCGTGQITAVTAQSVVNEISQPLCDILTVENASPYCNELSIFVESSAVAVDDGKP